jgi:hypothetical protein
VLCGANNHRPSAGLDGGFNCRLHDFPVQLRHRLADEIERAAAQKPDEKNRAC